ncbi:hypothetical protein B0I29_13152 [Actinoplanes lutulentus]|uniref:Uncharacterized protein n=1 Tax=Actinoplanes lutulentus TaxID=1287878 RepID=A0A327YWU2_9ACTN|nr:hypothetical protein B0I29_13152 [Actinoplanes lutulentus]
MLKSLICGLTLAALLASAGSWLGWRFAGDLPTDVEMRSVVAPLGVEGELWRDDAIATWADERATPMPWIFGTEDAFGPGFVIFETTEAVTDLGPLFTHVREDGWRVGGDHTAVKEDLRLSAVVEGDGLVRVRIERAAPMAAIVLSILGWLAGAVIGGLLGRRRLSLKPTVFAAAGVLFLLPNTIVATAGLIADQIALNSTVGFPIIWNGLLNFGLCGCYLIGICLMVGVFFIDWRLPGPAAPAPLPPSGPESPSA